MKNKFNECKYTPILSLSPSEMTAIEELPDKDKDYILPIFSLKGWANSNKLENSIGRIQKSISKRKWIAGLDEAFLQNYQILKLTRKYPRKVYYEIESLLNPEGGYDNWYNYLKTIPEAIPVVQFGDLKCLSLQIEKLLTLDRGIVFLFTLKNIESGIAKQVIDTISNMSINDLYVVYDLATVGQQNIELSHLITNLIERANEMIPNAVFSISSASFPLGFSGAHYGERPIYERLLFNKVSKSVPKIKMVYSDRGGARAEKQMGGGGIPAPRIDYPLKNDWRFIRKEFLDSNNASKEKKSLYTKIAAEMLKMEYWMDNLFLWGTQQIELTSKGDKYGINSPARATAVRINIHLYHQLHYDDILENIDTDEDWED